jgi:quercetin dioxygenase-like cupin family protein
MKLRLALLASAISAAAFRSMGGQQPDTSRVRQMATANWRQVGDGVEMALVDGNPQSTGEFTYLMRFRAGKFIPPHFHPNETRVLVVSGEVRVGFGDQLDTLHARVVGAGGFASIPGGAHHFEAGKTDAVVFLTGPGPLKTTMVGSAPGSHP